MEEPEEEPEEEREEEREAVREVGVEEEERKAETCLRRERVVCWDIT